jgi:hypothetical protein
MVDHIRQGNGAKDRDVPLAPNLLADLRTVDLDCRKYRSDSIYLPIT